MRPTRLTRTEPSAARLTLSRVQTTRPLQSAAGLSIGRLRAFVGYAATVENLCRKSGLISAEYCGATGVTGSNPDLDSALRVYSLTGQSARATPLSFGGDSEHIRQ